jgi:hypothetical protein
MKEMEDIRHYLNLSLEDIDGEEWVDILGYDGIYQVSNFGRVKSLSRYNTQGALMRERIMKQYINTCNTLMVGLRQPGGKSKQRAVSCLAGEGFIGFRDDYENVFCHKNKNTLDNRLCNILKTTRSNSGLIDFQCGKKKVIGFGGKSHRGPRPVLRSSKGVFIERSLYCSSLGQFTWKQLVNKYGRKQARNIYTASSGGRKSLGIKWNKINIEDENS